MDNKHPLVSILTVSYNAVKTIEQTMLSVLNQTYPNIEYIIIDGGSTDGTVDMIKKYADRLAYWVSERDKGIYDAMNKGIDKAKGELIGIINSDDWYELDCIENVIDEYKKDQNRVFYGILRTYKNNKQWKLFSFYPDAIPIVMIPHPTCFIPAILYKQKIGVYDTQYKYSADYDLIIRLYKHNISFCLINKILANFRCGGASSNRQSTLEAIAIRYRYKYISYIQKIVRCLFVNLFWRE